MAIPTRLIKTGSTVTGIAEFQTNETVDPIWLPVSSSTNLLINGDFRINQRNFAGGALAAGVFGYDRMFADTGGCNISVNAAGTITHTSGTWCQSIESPRNVFGTTVTVSVGDLSGGNLTVSVGGATGTITAGSGRRYVNIAVPASSGNLLVKVTGAGVTYREVAVLRGQDNSSFEYRHPALEFSLCRWYYSAIVNAAGMPFANASVRLATQIIAPLGFTQMRATPAATHSGALTAVIAGVVVNATATTATSASSSYMYLSLAVTGQTPGQAGYIYATPGNSSIITLDAEI